MRVGFDATPLIGPRTGIGWYTYELASALSHIGCDVTGLPVTWRKASDAEAPEGVRILRRFAPARPLRWMWSKSGFPPLEWFINCDVFHGTNFLAPPARSTPTVVTVHDLSFVRMPHTCAPATRRFAELLPSVLRRADAIIAISAFTADELCNWMPEVSGRVEIVHPGPRRREVVERTPSDEPAVLYVGGLDPRKNIPLLLDAAERLADVKFKLVGPANPLLDVNALVAERGLTNVELTGWLPDADVSQLIARATVLAWPSGYEGFGLPLIEAMRAGLPVVAVDAGPAGEVVAKAGILVDADPDAFAEALRRVIGSQDLQANLQSRGYEQAERFNWTDSATQTLEIYRRVTAG